MSAWLVSKEHIDVLVTAALAFKLIEESGATIVGEDLWQENVKSLEYRYPNGHDETPEPYHFSPRPTEDLFYIAKQASYYDYQACEHPSYPGSASARHIVAIQNAIQKATGLSDSEVRNHPSYDAAPWGVEDDEAFAT
jgi:hypothetical protein